MTGEVMRKQRDVQNRLSDRVADYEEYVEAWAHEIKTPISLTFLLDNRGGELPPQVSHKLDYIRKRSAGIRKPDALLRPAEVGPSGLSV